MASALVPPIPGSSTSSALVAVLRLTCSASAIPVDKNKARAIRITAFFIPSLLVFTKSERIEIILPWQVRVCLDVVGACCTKRQQALIERVRAGFELTRHMVCTDYPYR